MPSCAAIERRTKNSVRTSVASSAIRAMHESDSTTGMQTGGRTDGEGLQLCCLQTQSASKPASKLKVLRGLQTTSCWMIYLLPPLARSLVRSFQSAHLFMHQSTGWLVKPKGKRTLFYSEFCVCITCAPNLVVFGLCAKKNQPEKQQKEL